MTPSRTERRESWLLGIDTATSTVVVAAGTPAGRLLAVETFVAGHRHSEHLLPAIERLLGKAGLALADLSGLIAGTGPGAFTGLRVGLATAKTLAHQLGIPIVAVSTAEALLAASGEAGGGARLWLPAGPHERVAMEAGAGPMLERDLPEQRPALTEIAVDLAGRAAEDALERGRVAVAGLPAALVRLGAERLARGEVADPARIVPEYASPPRGIGAGVDMEQGVAWSRDRR